MNIDNRVMVSKNINENFVNSERVQKAFKDFIHALVWESLYIDEGAEENEVNKHIEEYCNTYINSRIKEESDNIINFLKNKEDDFKHEMYRQKISLVYVAVKNQQKMHLSIAQKPQKCLL